MSTLSCNRKKKRYWSYKETVRDLWLAKSARNGTEIRRSYGRCYIGYPCGSPLRIGAAGSTPGEVGRGVGEKRTIFRSYRGVSPAKHAYPLTICPREWKPFR